MNKNSCNVIVKYYATLRSAVGLKHEQFKLGDGSSVKDLLDEMVKIHPKLEGILFDANGNLMPHIHFFINEKSQIDQDVALNNKLKDGDIVSVFPSIGGGNKKAISC